MPQFFRGRSRSGAGPRLERDLDSLEQQAADASPGYETQFLTRAGNLCVDAGEPARALGYYGRAIDAYLESGRFGPAEVVCRKVLSIAPEAVRTRCTLAWLSIGRGYDGTTAAEIAEYVGAARRAGQEALAVKQLRMMAEAAVDVELRERLAEHLLELGDTEEADRILGTVYAERNGLRAPAAVDQAKLWARMLRAALMGPKELQGQRSPAQGEDGDAGDDVLPSLT